ncbi:MAG TPA: tripartite tricarboxylate transporter substrate binding protein [Burkholderiales bacterium]|jgi:tripartite-type tricarboxylate transporter receptor subunit TctC|nr:tripartite tricarboxylate transporter substrate binding protein [Burkholderiales bacterium]
MKVCRSVKTVIRRALPAMASLALLIPGAAIAQYPAKPVHLIVPFPAGGATDAAARELAEGLSHALGQTFVVDNRPGADGAIAAQAVVSANPDGYTLLFASSSMEGIPFVQKNAPFKTLNDLAPVSLVCRFVFGVAVNAGLPSRSMDEFVAYARANPGKLNYGSISLSEVMAAAQFMKATGTHLVKVGYKGAPQLVPDLAGNQIQVSFGPVSPLLPFVREGRVKVLGVLLDHRVAILPDALSVKEAHLAGVTGAGGLQAVMGPHDLPRDVAERLSTNIASILAQPATRAKFAQRGQEAEASSPQTLAKMISAERDGWVRFVADEGLKPE